MFQTEQILNSSTCIAGFNVYLETERLSAALAQHSPLCGSLHTPSMGWLTHYHTVLRSTENSPDLLTSLTNSLFTVIFTLD